MHRSTLPAHYLKKEHVLDIFLGERYSGALRDLPNNAETVLDPMRCDSIMLDTLAVEMMTDFWSDWLTEEEKRRFLEETISFKRKKGTLAALHDAFALLGVDVEVIEWFEDLDDPTNTISREPFTFIIVSTVENFLEAKSVELDEITQKRLISFVERFKNARSRFEYILKSDKTQGLAAISQFSVINMIDQTMYTQPSQEHEEEEISLIGGISIVNIAIGGEYV